MSTSTQEKAKHAETDGPGFRIRVSDDRMSVLLDCLASKESLLLLLARIADELAGMGLAQTPNREKLTQMLRSAAESGSQLADVVLVAGTPPVPPENGAIEWARDFFSTGFAVDEKSGTIDYRQRAANLAVSKGEFLARLVPPKEGKDGCDVFGTTVRVPKAKRAQLKAGPGVRMDEEDGGFRALTDGRIRLSGGLLAVDEVYSIPGNVGLETGNINHPGSLIIEGDVEAGSVIEADGDIEIKGAVEASVINAGGTITIRGGITGAPGQIIRAANSVHAKYILEAEVEAGDDIVVEKDIAQSIIRTRGAVAIPSGRLVGGDLTALGGITVGQVGSSGLVRTVLTAGHDHTLVKKVSVRKKKISQLEKAIDKVKSRVAPLMSRLKTLAAKQREAATELLGKVSEMEMSRDELNDEIKGFVMDSRKRTVHEIVVKTKAFPETVFQIKKARLQLKNEATGPLKAVLDQGEIVVRPA